ncbi:MAG: hypothetical protein Q9216_006189 [Gyalolechia sp. 2 TL-2023]
MVDMLTIIITVIIVKHKTVMTCIPHPTMFGFFAFVVALEITILHSLKLVMWQACYACFSNVFAVVQDFDPVPDILPCPLAVVLNFVLAWFLTWLGPANNTGESRHRPRAASRRVALKPTAAARSITVLGNVITNSSAPIILLVDHRIICSSTPAIFISWNVFITFSIPQSIGRADAGVFKINTEDIVHERASIAESGACHSDPAGLDDHSPVNEGFGTFCPEEFDLNDNGAEAVDEDTPTSNAPSSDDNEPKSDNGGSERGPTTAAGPSDSPPSSPPTTPPMADAPTEAADHGGSEPTIPAGPSDPPPSQPITPPMADDPTEEADTGGSERGPTTAAGPSNPPPSSPPTTPHMADAPTAEAGNGGSTSTLGPARTPRSDFRRTRREHERLGERYEAVMKPWKDGIAEWARSPNTSAPPAEEPDTAPRAKEPDTAPPAEERDTASYAEERDTASHAEEPDTASHAKEPDTASHAEEQDTAPLAEDPDTAWHAKEQDTAPPAEEPDIAPPAEEPDTAPGAKEPDTEPPAEQRDTASYAEEPDIASHAKEPETAPPAEERDTAPPSGEAPKATAATDEAPKPSGPSNEDIPVEAANISLPSLKAKKPGNVPTGEKERTSRAEPNSAAGTSTSALQMGGAAEATPSDPKDCAATQTQPPSPTPATDAPSASDWESNAKEEGSHPVPQANPPSASNPSLTVEIPTVDPNNFNWEELYGYNPFDQPLPPTPASESGSKQDDESPQEPQPEMPGSPLLSPCTPMDCSPDFFSEPAAFPFPKFAAPLSPCVDEQGDTTIPDADGCEIFIPSSWSYSDDEDVEMSSDDEDSEMSDAPSDDMDEDTVMTDYDDSCFEPIYNLAKGGWQDNLACL